MTYINPYMLFTGSMIPNWLMRRNEVSAGAKLTYARLCQYAGEHGVAWPAQQTLAREIGVEARQLRRYIAELEETKLIEARQQGLNKPNMYRFFHHEWMVDRVQDMSTPEWSDVTAPDRSDVTDKENQGRESFKPKKEARQSRLKDEWEPTQTDIDWSNEKHPTVDVILETTKFKNYHIGKGTMMVNWSRAWMTWIINAEGFNAKRVSPVHAAKPAKPAYDRDANMQRIFDAASAFERKRSGQ